MRRNTTLNSTTRIVNALGKYGPMTSKQLNQSLGITSASTRIYEINKMYRDFQILRNDKTKKYYISLLRNIRINHKKVYPNLYIN